MGEDGAYWVPEDVVEVSSVELRRELRRCLERVAFLGDELVITRAGEPVAAMVSMDAYGLLRKTMARLEDEADREAVADAKARDRYVSLDRVLEGRGDEP